MTVLSHVLISSNMLRVLDISETFIPPWETDCFANLRNISLHDLRMCGCSLDPTGADKIGEMLYHNNSITSLDLSDNYIRDRGVEKLVCHLNKSNHLQHLNLGSNEITEIGADHLRKLIAPDDTTLTSIELSDNPLGLQGVGIILIKFSKTYWIERHR